MVFYAVTINGSMAIYIYLFHTCGVYYLCDKLLLSQRVMLVKYFRLELFLKKSLLQRISYSVFKDLPLYSTSLFLVHDIV